MPRLVHHLLARRRQRRKQPGRRRQRAQRRRKPGGHASSSSDNIPKLQLVIGYLGEEFSYGFDVVPRAKKALQGHWCLSFATVMCVEAHFRRKHGNHFPALSVQHCIDEVGSTDVDEVAQWLVEEGVTEEQYYPLRVNERNFVFKGDNSYKRAFPRHKVKYTENPPLRFLVEYLKHDGPFVGFFWVRSDLDARGTHYGGLGENIYYKNKFLGHSVLVIGCGINNGENYWIYLDNNGENWGLKGNGTATMKFDLFDDALIPYVGANPDK